MGESAIAVLGSAGGREFELTRVLTEADHEVIGIGGNDAMARELGAKIVAYEGPEAAAKYIYENEIGLTIIGPEQPLVDGVADMIRANGQLVFGPGAEGAKLEASKVYSRDFMERHGIPQPESVIVTGNTQDAMDQVKAMGGAERIVLKADGLAGGKGVILPHNETQARNALDDMLSGKIFGGAGETTVIQEKLHGPEASMFVVLDGSGGFTILPLSQDHKRLLDGDEGPNTGGMGAFSSSTEMPFTDQQTQKAYEIAEQTAKALIKEGIDYKGVLFTGLMFAEERGGDPVVIEYNVRFGDPETQVVLPVAQDQGYELGRLFMQAAEGSISEQVVNGCVGSAALTVCLAGEGYPASKYPEDPRSITGLLGEYPNSTIHHAATKWDNRRHLYVSGGGRILYATGYGSNIDRAAEAAYSTIGPFDSNRVSTPGGHFRADIGHQVRSA